MQPECKDRKVGVRTPYGAPGQESRLDCSLTSALGQPSELCQLGCSAVGPGDGSRAHTNQPRAAGLSNYPEGGLYPCCERIPSEPLKRRRCSVPRGDAILQGAQGLRISEVELNGSPLQGLADNVLWPNRGTEQEGRDTSHFRL